MTESLNDQIVRGYFEASRPRFTKLASRFVDDPAVVIDVAAKIFDEMLSDLAYRDKPDHPLAPALFIPVTNLAMYLALKERGVDVHAFGGALLYGLARAPIPPQPADDRPVADRVAPFIELAEMSRSNAVPGEDVFEAFLGSDEDDFEFGYNIRSCAICHQYAKYDAMDLVPYMCATDDIVSERNNQGLRRTGTIALGAHQCDFRYKTGRTAAHIAEQYPDRIRVFEPR
jgi:hypothetical protein